jgi:hypothetical protein
MREVEARLATLAATGRGSTINLCEWNLPALEYRQLRLALAPDRLSTVTAAPIVIPFNGEKAGGAAAESTSR